MITVAQLAVEVVGNTDKVNASLGQTNEEVEKSGGLFSSLKGFAGNALSTLMGFVGGQIIFAGLNAVMSQVTQMFGDMVDEASNLQTAESQLNAVLTSTHDASGESAQAINDMADQLSNLSGVSESTILQGQDMLLTFTNIGSTTFPLATQAMLNMAIAMNGGSTANLNLSDTAIQLGKALNDPLTGLTALKREGVTFSDSEVALIKHFMAVGDVADAQKVMLKELQTEFGGSAKAAGSTFGGALDKLKNTLVDFGANALLKVEGWAQPFITMLADDLPGALDTAGKFVGQLGSDIGGLFNKLTGGKGINLGQMFGDMTKGMNFGGIVKDLQSFGQTVQGQVLPIATQLSGWFKSDMQPAIQSVMPDVQSFAQFIINDIVPAFIQFQNYGIQVEGTLAKLLLPIFEKVEPIVVRLAGYLLHLSQQALAFLIPKVEEAAKQVSEFATAMAVRLGPFIKRIGSDITTVAGIVSAIWGFLWPWVSALLKTAWDDITGVLNIAWQLIKGLFEIGADLLSGNWSQLWADIQSTVNNVWGAIKSFLGNMWNDVQGIFTTFGSLLGNAWGDIWNGLSGVVSGVWNDVLGLIQDGINLAIGLINKLIDAADVVPGVNIPHIPNIDLTGGVVGPGTGAGAGSKQGSQHFAGGGIMPYSGMALVGEQGPEAVFLPQGAQVYSNAQTQALLGRGGNTYNFNGITTPAQTIQYLQAEKTRQQSLAFGGSR